jgi:Ran GTPase-activating protein (RanGAP) involved in mRNA processing and transport
MAIAEALRNNEVLNDLNLQGNQIGDQGAFALAEVLETNAHCTVLNLEHNQLTDEGGRMLVGVLKSNTSALETLYLGSNKVSKELVAEAEEESRLAFRPPVSHSTAAQLPEREEL